MTSEEQTRMSELCEQIATEKDAEKFDELVKELNDMLELRHERIHPDNKAS